MPEEAQKMMEAWAKLAAPGDSHEHLEPFVGSWETVTRVWMAGPDGPATESRGVSQVRWVLGGRFIMENLKGELLGRPYEGLGLIGYDNARNLYVGSWADTSGTHLLTMKGTRNPETGTFTFYGEMDEPMMNVYGRTVKYVNRVVNKNKHVFQIFDLHAGDEYKVVEVTYTRK